MFWIFFRMLAVNSVSDFVVLSLLGSVVSACTKHSGQKLLPVVVRRLKNQIDRARDVTESEKHRIHMPKFLLVVTWSSHDHHVIIWTNQSLADILQLSPYVSVKLIHVDRSDLKMLMPPDLNTGVCDIKTEPITAHLVILPSPHLWSNISLSTDQSDTFVEMLHQ